MSNYPDDFSSDRSNTHYPGDDDDYLCEDDASRIIREIAERHASAIKAEVEAELKAFNVKGKSLDSDTFSCADFLNEMIVECVWSDVTAAIVEAKS